MLTWDELNWNEVCLNCNGVVFGVLGSYTKG